jgi:hypothetical protein
MPVSSQVLTRRLFTPQTVAALTGWSEVYIPKSSSRNLLGPRGRFCVPKPQIRDVDDGLFQGMSLFSDEQLCMRSQRHLMGYTQFYLS